jgi:MATE family multidrug resistance protein
MVAPLGEASLAAVTTGAMDVLCLVMLPLGMMFILQSFAAQLRGKGELETAGRYAYYGLLVAACAGLVGILLLPFLGPALGLIGYEPAVREKMDAYMTIRFLSVAALIGSEGLSNWYGGMGNTRIALVTTTITTVANVFLNYVLIEPRFGLPGYGVVGAAWASTIATALGFVLLLGCFLARVGHEVPRRRPRLQIVELNRMLRFGLPSGMNYFLEFAAFALFINVVVGRLGTTTLAAFNIVFQLNMLAFMPAFGVASAGAILVGEAIGGGESDRVGALTGLALKLAAGWMVLVGLCYIVIPEPFIRLFSDKSESGAELLQMGAFMLAMSGIWQLFDAIAMTITESLRAAGDTAWPMAARVFLAWFVFTPGAWISVLVLEGGTLAVMLSVVVYLALLALLLIYRFRTGAWRRISLTGPAEAAVAA